MKLIQIKCSEFVNASSEEWCEVFVELIFTSVMSIKFNDNKEPLIKVENQNIFFFILCGYLRHHKMTLDNRTSCSATTAAATETALTMNANFF